MSPRRTPSGLAANTARADAMPDTLPKGSPDAMPDAAPQASPSTPPARRGRPRKARNGTAPTIAPTIAPDICFAGVDEAGRGCLAGPVVAAAVILPAHHTLTGLDDSKALTEARRDALAPLIRQQAVAWGVGVIWPWDIDRHNILQATFRAMSRAVACLRTTPELLVIDGNMTVPPPLLIHFLRGSTLPQQQSVVGGDALVPAISAASILAKTFRDRLMTSLHNRYPHYGFAQHKGYGTQDHLAAITSHGPCRQHRLTFRGVKPEQQPPVQLTLC